MAAERLLVWFRTSLRSAEKIVNHRANLLFYPPTVTINGIGVTVFLLLLHHLDATTPAYWVPLETQQEHMKNKRHLFFDQ